MAGRPIAFGMRGRKSLLGPGFDAATAGFENAELPATAPFLGSCGGPCIDGVHVVAMDDLLAGRRLPDHLSIELTDVYALLPRRGLRRNRLSERGPHIAWRLVGIA